MKNKEDCSSKPDFLRVPFRARCLSAKQHRESNVMNEFDSKLMSSKKKKRHFYNSLYTESSSLNTEVPRIFA